MPLLLCSGVRRAAAARWLQHARVLELVELPGLLADGRRRRGCRCAPSLRNVGTIRPCVFGRRRCEAGRRRAGTTTTCTGCVLTRVGRLLTVCRPCADRVLTHADGLRCLTAQARATRCTSPRSSTLSSATTDATTRRASRTSSTHLSTPLPWPASHQHQHQHQRPHLYPVLQRLLPWPLHQHQRTTHAGKNVAQVNVYVLQ